MTERAVRLFTALILALVWIPAADAAERVGAVASAHPLADAAGMEVLERGGNAFDAAVAVSAALSVVEPYSSGIGGGGFYLLHRAEAGLQVMVDGRETAPAASSVDLYLDESGELVRERAREGALSAGIPGTPAALAHIADRYGELALAESLAPAIRLAEAGFEVDARFADMTVRYRDRLERHCLPDCPFLPDGRPLRPGERLLQPALAATLRTLAADGGESFYRGETAQALVEAVAERGGVWTRQDLADYRVVEREPAVGRFGEHRIVTASPPSSGGITLLQSLGMLGSLPEAADDASRIHQLAEVWRRAFRDRNALIGDPDFVDVPAARMLDPHYLAELAEGIRHDRATPSSALPAVDPLLEGESTSHYSVVDAAGNRVAATQTVNYRFGAGIVAEGTGVTLNNELYDFAIVVGEPDAFGLIEGRTNLIEPGKRPLSSMTPTFIEGPDRTAVLGTPGGSWIITMVTLGVLDFVAGGDAASMVSLERFHHQYLPDRIVFEPGALDPGLASRLRCLGHEVVEDDDPHGNMNVVIVNADGSFDVAHDPRNKAYAVF